MSMFRTFLATAVFTSFSTLPALAEQRDPGTLEEPELDLTATPIVGGTVVPPGKWPDTVAVLGTQGSCTGTLIAPDVVLTAGHCEDANPTQVVANTTNFNAPGGIRAQVRSVIAYPNWENTFDVAVVLLQQPITGVTPRAVGAGCTFQDFTENRMVRLVGFGLTDVLGQGDNTVLHEAMAPVLDADCSGGNGCAPGAAPAGEFVAGGNGTDSCYGDSGGPVYLDTPRGTMVIGAVSRGLDNSPTPCGGGGIYVRTDKILTWIEQVAGKPVSKDSCVNGTPPGGDEEPAGGGDGDGGGNGDGNGGGDGTGGGQGPQGPAPDLGGADVVTGGCSAAGGSSGAALALALGALLAARRRRR